MRSSMMLPRHLDIARHPILFKRLRKGFNAPPSNLWSWWKIS